MIPSRRRLLAALAATAAAMPAHPAAAAAPGAALASYYDRHAALVDGVAWGWVDRGAPQRLLAGVRQVGVSREAWFLLRDDGTLVMLAAPAATPAELMRGVRRFAAGASGWFAIDAAGTLWRGGAGDGTAPQRVAAIGTAPQRVAAIGTAPQRVAEGVVAMSIGDGADYWVGADGRLWVTGLAHRGQYGDGRLQQTPGYLNTARDVRDVKAHTGHAIALQRDGTVIGTGGNRFGPLSSHGLGDKADRWGPIFDGAVAIATGSRHSAAIRADGSLWVWGEGFGIAPRKLMDRVAAVAAGDSATIVLDADGALRQWDGGAGPRRLALPR
jgi:alpha-tubulin suppressor-like RCC1 family protein